nr:TIGR02300 family protein [Niveispirillum irakense]
MAKPEWGVKRICPSCGARYYDMRKDPPVCPSCGTTFDPEALLRSRRARPIPVEDAKKPAPRDEEALDRENEEELEEVVEDTVDDDADVADEIEADDVDDAVVDEDEDVLLEDADELDDGDDMGEVVDIENDEDR